MVYTRDSTLNSGCHHPSLCILDYGKNWLVSEILVMIAGDMCLIYREPSGADSMLYCWSPSQCCNGIQHFSLHML